MPDPTSHPYVPRPAELHGASLRELAEGYHGHIGALVNHEHGIGRPEPIGRLRASALGALAIGEQVIRRMHADRWTTVRDALRLGASVDDVALALDVEADDVITGMTVWAHGQHVNGLMDAEQHRAVFALLQQRRAR